MHITHDSLKSEVDFSPNLNFIREFDDGHIINRLYVYWDISTICNFKCSYCYARADYIYKNQWNKIDTFQHQKSIINSLSLSKFPIYLGLHGGEPTLHPKLIELIEYSFKKLPKNSQIYIATNGCTKFFSKNFSRLEKYKSSLRFLFTCHFEYEKQYGKNFEVFLNNVKNIKNKGFKTKINIMLSDDKQYWEKIRFVFNESLKICQTHPHFVYNCSKNSEKLLNYTNDFFEYFKDLMKSQCFYTFETKNTYCKVTDYVLFKNKLNMFKNWKCWNNNYEIKWNGIVKKLCTFENIDLLKNPFYFKKIRNINYMICQFDECMSDGVLKCLKEK